MGRNLRAMLMPLENRGQSVKGLLGTQYGPEPPDEIGGKTAETSRFGLYQSRDVRAIGLQLR